MNFKNIKNKIQIFPHIFNSFDGGYFLYKKEYIDINILEESKDFKEVIINTLNYSFDGTFFYFKDIEKGKLFLEKIKNKLKSITTEIEDYDFQDDGFSNALFFKYLKDGLLILDAKTDYGSIVDEFLEDFEFKDDVDIYFSSHLIERLYLGRIEESYDKFFKFLYDQNFFKSSYIFNTPIKSENKKNIVLLGNFDFELNIYFLNIDKNISLQKNIGTGEDWIWLGDNPDLKTLNKAKELGCKISTINEVIDILYSNYNRKKDFIEISKI